MLPHKYGISPVLVFRVLFSFTYLGMMVELFGKFCDGKFCAFPSARICFHSRIGFQVRVASTRIMNVCPFLVWIQ